MLSRVSEEFGEGGVQKARIASPEVKPRTGRRQAVLSGSDVMDRLELEPSSRSPHK